MSKIFSSLISKAIAIGLLCSFSLLAFGQTGGNRWLKKADQELQEKNYPKAIEYYEWASRSSEEAGPWIGMGMAYRSLSDYDNAAKSFAKAVQFPGVTPETYFYHGHALLSTGNKEDAKEWFLRYAEAVPEADRAISFESLEQLTSQTPLDSSELQLNLASFNSRKSDFSPAIRNNDLYFCSSRKSGNSLLTYTSTIDNAPLVDLFMAPGYFDSSQTKVQIQPVKSLNSRVNEGPMCFSSDGNTMFFTRNNPDQVQSRRNNPRLNKLRLYRSRWENETWSTPFSLPFNSSEFANGHPTLSNDGRFLYFASDRPGGYGGTDLYRVELIEDGFGEPENLGARVNSSGDEMFPFIAPDDVLYYSSDGILGFGGLDIFKSILQETGWTRPVNLGMPLNSNADDFGIVLIGDKQQGFFTSNRNRKPENDEVYTFGFLRPRFTCQPQQKNSYCYELVEEGSFDLETDTTATDTSPMIYQWDFGDGEKAIGLKVQHCFPGPGTYLVQLNLIDTVSDFVFLNEATYELEIEDIEQVYIDAPDTIPTGTEVVFNGNSSVVPGCEIRKYFWESSDGRRSTGITWPLRFEDPGTYQIRLGVDGYQSGKAEPCQTCSTKEIVVVPPHEYNPIKPPVVKEQNPEVERWLNFSDSLSKLKPTMEPEIHNDGQPGQPSKVYDFPPIPDGKSQNQPKGNPLGGRDPYMETPRQLVESIVLPVVPRGQTIGTEPIEFKRVPVRIEGPLAFIKPNAGESKEFPVPISQLTGGLVLEKDNGKGSLSYEIAYMELEEVENLDSCIGCLPISYYNDQSQQPLDSPEIEEEIRFEKLADLIDKGIPVRINNIHFDFDSYAIKPESRQILISVGRLIIDTQPGKVILQGHTDDRGSEKYNLWLSEKRASEVLKFFVLQGMTTLEIDAVGYGEGRPIAPNNSSEGRYLNRRVEFILESSSLGPGK